jgi:alpha-galactosidase
MFRLCAAGLAALALASAQGPTGKWVAKFSPDDEAREIVLALNVESGGKVTGYVLAPNYEDRIVEGTASGGRIAFVAEREANNNTMRRSDYSAVLEGDKLKLIMPTFGNRPPQVIEFTRASAQAPAPLPPPPPKIALAAPAPMRDNGLARTPPMGWNSWNKFQGKVNDKVVREIADAMAKNGMKARAISARIRSFPI